MKKSRLQPKHSAAADWAALLAAILEALPPDWDTDPRAKRLKTLTHELPSPSDPNLLELRLKEIDFVLNDLADTSQALLRAMLPDVK